MFIAIAVVLSLFASRASALDNMYKTANDYGNCRDLGSSTHTFGFCQTDNASWTFYVDPQLSNWDYSSTAYANIYWVMNNEYSPTDLNPIWQDPPVYSGSSETDVVMLIRSDIPFPAQGTTWCDDAVDGTHCDQHYIAFLNQSVVTYPLVCHELGHSVGLTHGMDADPSVSQSDWRLGCMKTPVDSGDTLGSNNISEINATY